MDEKIKQEIQKYLKSNLSISVDTKIDYGPQKTMVVRLKLEDEVISETQIEVAPLPNEF